MLFFQELIHLGSNKEVGINCLKSRRQILSCFFFSLFLGIQLYHHHSFLERLSLRSAIKVGVDVLYQQCLKSGTSLLVLPSSTIRQIEANYPHILSSFYVCTRGLYKTRTGNAIVGSTLQSLERHPQASNFYDYLYIIQFHSMTSRWLLQDHFCSNYYVVLCTHSPSVQQFPIMPRKLISSNLTTLIVVLLNLRQKSITLQSTQYYYYCY